MHLKKAGFRDPKKKVKQKCLSCGPKDKFAIGLQSNLGRREGVNVVSNPR